MKKYKTYKVNSIYQNNQYVPMVQLRGKWLENLGFQPNEVLIVKEKNNKLIISLPNEKEKQEIANFREEKQKKKLIEQLKKM